MSNTEKTLRDRYFSNEIFRIGEMVTDTKTGEQMKILDRGSNYVTVATETTVIKKWLNEVTETVVAPVETVVAPQETIIESKIGNPNYNLLPSGQIKLFGYETKNFDKDSSEFVIEQFGEFDDLYSQHQIIKCLDMALADSDKESAYNLLEKVSKFYSTKNIDAPLIVEVTKNEIERTRLAEILATIADITPSRNNNTTVTESIKALKEKYQSKKQWDVLLPFLKMAQSAGLSGATQNLPFSMVSLEEMKEHIVLETLFENIDLVVDDLDFDDINETFTEDEFSDQDISESLSIEGRNKLALKMKQHSPQIAVRREKALDRAASASVLMQRARRLAETMIKRRMFHKAPQDMSRQDKERFEAGNSSRTALIAKLAQKLLPKVRELQTSRIHHTQSNASQVHDKATSDNARRVNAVGAA